MAKRKRKEQEPVEAKGDAYEPPSVSASDLSGPWDGAGDVPASDGQSQPVGEQQAESPGRQQPPQRAEKKPRSVLGRYFKDRRVELIDDCNAGGVGIKLGFDDPAERPSEEIKAILKEGDDKRPGFAYRGDKKEWRKRIGANADPRTAVAIRLDAERRFEAVGEQMGHEERLKAERDRGDGPGEKIPS